MTIERDMSAIRRLYDEINDVLSMDQAVRDLVVPKVSAWTPIEQIAHVSKANRWVLSSLVAILTRGMHFEESGRPTAVGRFVLGTGFIPRGIGKAPSAAQPDTPVKIDRLRDTIETQMRHLDTIYAERQEAARSRQQFRHPVFGFLTPRQWIRFVHVHTKHHMKIVRDILIES